MKVRLPHPTAPQRRKEKHQLRLWCWQVKHGPVEVTGETHSKVEDPHPRSVTIWQHLINQELQKTTEMENLLKEMKRVPPDRVSLLAEDQRRELMSKGLNDELQPKKKKIYKENQTC